MEIIITLFIGLVVVCTVCVCSDNRRIEAELRHREMIDALKQIESHL